MNKAAKGGRQSQRKNLEQVAKTLRKLGRHAEADATTKQLDDLPPLPGELRYLWHWYFELAATKQVGGTSSTVWQQPLQHVEILAWSQLTGVATMPWEVRMLRSLDRKYQEVMHE